MFGEQENIKQGVKSTPPGPFLLCHLVIRGDQVSQAGPALNVHLFLNISAYIQLPTTEFH